MTTRTVAIPKGAIRIPVPDTRQQTDYTCGAASLRAVCEYFGVGPRTEREFVADMGMPVTGADPQHFIRALKRYGLRFRPFHRMSVGQLKGSIDSGRPVIMMLQAWATPKRGRIPPYERDWLDGHWVVAIGHDEHGVYFEDPSLRTVRGFMSYKELEVRWHDVGPHYGHMYFYGLSVWNSDRPNGDRPGQTGRLGRATHID
jgi:predicted double-glycine peptidase